MTATVTELDEAVETTEGGGDKPLLHAYCEVCRWSAAPGVKVPSMCGQGRGVDSEDELFSYRDVPPEDLCVICVHMAPKPCPKCGV